MTAQTDIEDLIARVAMGDRGAFRSLYDRTSAKLFGVCLRVLSDPAEAEEALQESFVRIWDKAGQYRVNGFSPMTWLITLARNVAIDRRRRLSGAARPAPIEAADLVADTAPGPERQAMARAEAAQLAECLRELPPDRAAMVRRAYLDGDTYAMLAEATGVKLNTVRTWLRRSLMQLRECLSR
ncbi:sigma-70 family RNA polymerase sigma factor [Aestuariicoccus sp. MJ-SS9]|uniref:sigma-70 family RNA polymerase sigma factor n=1 Tax=Aestuariicoccus sp. MJ-SS9 TaxID=3079855 RepID=UPI00290C7207|nr:sigma-70 family RNA polymerase sigma factor [Aestuariicoccus sp. MJ-SS9]MDU8911142.1 sigma-70 family RNA polymerase sigma factor [Aestuariicoccus sp. MJ-SS9]